MVGGSPSSIRQRVAAEDAKVELSAKVSELRRLQKEFHETAEMLRRTQMELGEKEQHIAILKERIQERDANAYRDQARIEALQRQVGSDSTSPSQEARPTKDFTASTAEGRHRRLDSSGYRSSTDGTQQSAASPLAGGLAAEDDIEKKYNAKEQHVVNGLVAWAATLLDSAYYRTSEELSAVERSMSGTGARGRHKHSGLPLPDARKVSAQVDTVARLLCRNQFLDANLTDARRKEYVAVWEELSSLAIDPNVPAEESLYNIEVSVGTEHKRLSMRLKALLRAARPELLQQRQRQER